jgi:hypothetical protein
MLFTVELFNFQNKSLNLYLKQINKKTNNKCRYKTCAKNFVQLLLRKSLIEKSHDS